MIIQLDKKIKFLFLLIMGMVMSSNVYSNKSASTFKNIVVISSSKIYRDDRPYKNNLKIIGVDKIEDIYFFKNIKVDFIYDAFYKKMNGEGFLISISSDKSVDLKKTDIEDLVLVIENLLNIKLDDQNKSTLFLANKKNTPKFKIVINEYDLWFDFYPQTSSANSYFECFVAISKNKPA